MACTLHVAWDERLTGYDFGPGHPLAPVRVELTIALAEAFGVLAEPGVTVAEMIVRRVVEMALEGDAQAIALIFEHAGKDS